MSFGSTRIVRRTRKRCRCSWCGEWVQAGDHSISGSYSDGSDFWSFRLHPECWRAERAWWFMNSNEDEGPDCHMKRGSTADEHLEWSTVDVRFTADPVTPVEVNTYGAWFLHLAQGLTCLVLFRSQETGRAFIDPVAAGRISLVEIGDRDYHANFDLRSVVS